MFENIYILDGEGSGVMMEPLHARTTTLDFFGEGCEADYVT